MKDSNGREVVIGSRVKRFDGPYKDIYGTVTGFTGDNDSLVVITYAGRYVGFDGTELPYTYTYARPCDFAVFVKQA